MACPVKKLASFVLAVFVSAAALFVQPAYGANGIVVSQESIPDNFPEQELKASVVTAVNGERETLDVPVISWRDLPFQTVKKQGLDYSCGSAAISTLLTYVYGAKTSEGSVFKTMFEAGNKNKIRREGFSLLDMSNYLNRNGFKAVGYKVALDVIEKNRVPFIGLINDNGYNHFVVVKSVKGPLVLVGDSNKGNVIYHRANFEKIWNGIALIVTNNAKKAHLVFENEDEWKFAHVIATPTDADYHGIGGTVLSPLQWQIAPARTELLSTANQATQLMPGLLSGIGGSP